MVPTARAYAGLCQEIQKASSYMERGACLHKQETVYGFYIESIAQRIVSMLSVFWLLLLDQCLSWWKYTLSSRFCKIVATV